MKRDRGSRMRKVNELMREVIAEEAAKLKDPRIGFLTITDVRTSPDLRTAKVYFSVLNDEDQEGTQLRCNRPIIACSAPLPARHT